MLFTGHEFRYHIITECDVFQCRITTECDVSRYRTQLCCDTETRVLTMVKLVEQHQEIFYVLRTFSMCTTHVWQKIL